MITLDEKKMKEVVSSFQIPTKPEILRQLQEAMRKVEPDISATFRLPAKRVQVYSNH